MTIISRYIIKEFFKYFVLVQVVVITLFVFIDYLTKIGKFIKADMALTSAFAFVLLKIPFIFTMLMPVCCVLAMIIVFRLMIRNNELLAMKSSGMSVYTVMQPVVVIGILTTLIFFIVAEYVMPVTQTSVNEIKRIIRHKDVKTTNDNNIWLKRDNVIVNIKYYDSIKQSLSGLTLLYFDKDFNLEKRIDAAEAQYNNPNWLLKNVHEMERKKTNDVFFSQFYVEKILEADMKPEDLKSIIRKSQEMSIKQLNKYVKKVKSQGYEPVSYIVDMNAKISFPFACFLMCFIGAGIALTGKRTQGLATGIAMGICLSFFFWFFHSFCISLGYGEILPPIVAAWLSNIVFTCIGGVILLNAE